MATNTQTYTLQDGCTLTAVTKDLLSRVTLDGNYVHPASVTVVTVRGADGGTVRVDEYVTFKDCRDGRVVHQTLSKTTSRTEAGQ